MSSAGAGGSRLVFIDALKAVASQLIVLHHLAFYGPMSDHALSLAPDLMGWLYDYARIAVQAFLVIGGFLAAQALAPDGRLKNTPPLSLLWRRYMKLAPPYIAALLLAILAAALANRLMFHSATPAAPSIAQVIAHVFLLQSILGFDGLSAGIWYIAIDFQLYALLLATLWVASRCGKHGRSVGIALVGLLLVASLFHFNRDAAWDSWAIYFFGSYGLGALVFWSIRRNKASPWLLLIIGLAVIALAIDFRLRIAVALTVALALGAATYTGLMARWPESKTLAWLGKISYAVFLTHYPVCLVINAIFERFLPHDPAIQLAGMVIAWLSSIAFGAIFYKHVESHAQRLLTKKA